MRILFLGSRPGLKRVDLALDSAQTQCLADFFGQINSNPCANVSYVIHHDGQIKYMAVMDDYVTLAEEAAQHDDVAQLAGLLFAQINFSLAGIC